MKDLISIINFNPAEFKQSVDFINRNEILKHGAGSKYYSPSELAQTGNKCLIVSHYLKNSQTKDLGNDSFYESEVA